MNQWLWGLSHFPLNFFLKTSRLDEANGGIESNVLTLTFTSSLVLEKETEKENANNLERETAYFRETK